MEYVYVVGRCSYEGMSVDYVCRSEETAKDKFNEILAHLTGEEKDMCAEFPWDGRKHLNFLEVQTFEKQEPENLISTIPERPYWKRMEVIP